MHRTVLSEQSLELMAVAALGGLLWDGRRELWSREHWWVCTSHGATVCRVEGGEGSWSIRGLLSLSLMDIVVSFLPRFLHGADSRIAEDPS